MGLTPLDHFLQRAMLVAGARQARPRCRRGDDDDAAQREGARVSRRLHHGARGRTLSARQGVRRSGDARGGAPPLLRRHHARRAEALPHARRGAAAQRRVHAVQGVELPRGDSGGHARAAQDDQGAQLGPLVHAVARRRQPVGQLARRAGLDRHELRTAVARRRRRASRRARRSAGRARRSRARRASTTRRSRRTPPSSPSARACSTASSAAA